jgi:long-chain fatty acid transport protein
MELKKLVGVLAVAGCVVPGAALATNGYFSHGYGMKAKGMAGASTALAADAFGGASNPASMVWVGDRLDIGLDWFSPERNAARTGSPDAPNGGLNGSADSDSKNFFIPEFGYNKLLNPNLSVGITVYGNGGMNTDYPNGQITSANGVNTCNMFLGMGGQSTAGTSRNMLCGTSKLGVDLMQLVIAPSVAYKVSANHSIGVSPLLGYQRFKAEGLHAFAAYASVADRDKVTNNGYDSATGWGVRVGWMGKVSDSVTLGAAYSSKIDMSKFDKYRGLFAEQGDFDMPENYNLGIALKATPVLTVAADYQRINYSGVKSVANPSTNGGAAITGTLGGDNGRGFGWSDVDVWKIGLEYQYNDKLTMRAGYSHTSNPIQSRDVTFNIIAPGVVQDHYTLGLTYNLQKNSELTVSYMHAAKNSVTGSSLFNTAGWPTAGSAGNEKIEMYENSLGVAYGMKF